MSERMKIKILSETKYRLKVLELAGRINYTMLKNGDFLIDGILNAHEPKTIYLHKGCCESLLEKTLKND